MKQLYYVVQTLLHGRNANVIKIVSLGLGLMMSILLFARVAFDLSYDTCFKDYQNLYQVWSVYTINGEPKSPQQMNLGPVPGSIYQNFPNEVESATCINNWALPLPLLYGNAKFDELTISADSLFFETMGIEVLKGNPRQDMQQKDVVYLSERLAKRIFADENPIDKILRYGQEMDFTVKGVYATIPENSTLKAEVVVSMPTIRSRNIGNYGWNGGDSWYGYVRVKPGINTENLNKRIELLMQQNVPSNASVKISAFVQPIYKTFQSYEDPQRRRIIMGILGGAILFIAAMNYVLLSLSSLSRRAKAIGVHKCSGAETSTIFGMFLWETAIILIFSLLLMTFLVLNFQDFVEECMDGLQLESFFIGRVVWVPFVAIALLFCIGGILPAQLFARIPVTQVFKRYAEGKKGWKRPLLFVQFGGVAFVAGLMCIVWMQNNHLNHFDFGYNKERVAFGYHATEEQGAEAVRHFYEGLPYVESVSSSEGPVVRGYNGEIISEVVGKPLFASRYDYWNEDYPSFMGLTFLEGRMPMHKDEVAVNETFIKKINWDSNILGKIIYRNVDLDKYKVVGVLKDFKIGNINFNTETPFVAHYRPTFGNFVHLRLKEPFIENLQRLNKEVGEAFPGNAISFDSMEAVIRGTYANVFTFGKVTTVATVVVLFITLMGLIGYTNDETQRRSKEIAIRKVNGAEASGILELLAKDVLVTALPAVLLGTLASWYVGELWMSQFATVVGSTIPYYIMTALVTLLMIIGVVVVKTWKIANENPVISIKSE